MSRDRVLDSITVLAPARLVHRRIYRRATTPWTHDLGSTSHQHSPCIPTTSGVSRPGRVEYRRIIRGRRKPEPGTFPTSLEVPGGYVKDLQEGLAALLAAPSVNMAPPRNRRSAEPGATSGDAVITTRGARAATADRTAGRPDVHSSWAKIALRSLWFQADHIGKVGQKDDEDSARAAYANRPYS